MVWSIDELRKIRLDDVLTAALAFVVLLSPGLLVLFIFYTDLAKEIATMKLILLSMSITVPVYVLVLLAVLGTKAVPMTDGESNLSHSILCAAAALLATGGLFYVTIAFTFKGQIEDFLLLLWLLGLTLMLILKKAGRAVAKHAAEKAAQASGESESNPGTPIRTQKSEGDPPA